MNKPLLIILIMVAVLAAGTGGYLLFNKYHQKNSNDAVTPNPSDSSSIDTISQSVSSSPAIVNKIKIFLIAVGDAGKTGLKIGCDDSAVFIERPITPTITPLKTSIEELINLKTRDYSQSGLTNALADSTLVLKSANISNSKATIKLTGDLRVSGVCQAPEIQAQFEQTALQFSTVKSVEFFINDQKLTDLLSQKGE